VRACYNQHGSRFSFFLASSVKAKIAWLLYIPHTYEYTRIFEQRKHRENIQYVIQDGDEVHPNYRPHDLLVLTTPNFEWQ
jgi:hypothetical protein